MSHSNTKARFPALLGSINTAEGCVPVIEEDSEANCHHINVSVNAAFEHCDSVEKTPGEHGSNGSETSGGSECYGTFPGDQVLVEYKLYPTRYLMLLLFVLCTMMNGFQWIQYSIITSIMCCYYNVGVTDVNWTSVIFMVSYIPVNFPVIWFMNAKGLRFTLILAAAGNCLSSCVQCLSIGPSQFYVVIISQIIGSISQCFTLSVPPLIAATWFGSEEVSLACSIGVFGNQLGNALGFLIPPLLVTNDCGDTVGIGHGLTNLAFLVVSANALLFLAVVFVFKDKPKTPPSLAEAKKQDRMAVPQTMRPIWNMMKDSQFLMLFLAYGLVLPVYFAISTMLNQMVVKHFPHREVDAGRMGLISVFSGMAGCIVCGYILDRTHKYRFFVSGYISVGFEVGAEMTYPEPEGTSASLLNLSIQAFGIVITMFGSWLFQVYGDLISNMFFCGCMFVGCVIVVFIKCDMKRRKQYEKQESLQQPIQ